MPGTLAVLKEMVIAGDGDRALTLTEGLIADGLPPRRILDDGLLLGMDVVGARMKAGDCFIPEVLLSARAMQACLDLVKPHLAEGDTGSAGRVVIGTVEGDVHDIGKNIVAMMLEGAGFEVVNLGTGVSAAAFVDAVRLEEPDILGMSALLTTTIPRMVDTIAALEEAGLRSQVKVLVGGAPVNQAYAAHIGADAYGANAALAVEKARGICARA